MRNLFCLGLWAVACQLWLAWQVGASAPPANSAEEGAGRSVRIAAAQPRARLVDWHLQVPNDVLAEVNQILDQLEEILAQAAQAKCDAIALPEDTLGLGPWLAANEPLGPQVLPQAVDRMLERLGRAAAEHQMYVVCCNDVLQADGSMYNTAFLLGRNGAVIGRYHKVNLPITESNKKRGDAFPVFDTADLGAVGMLICYDMVFPEAARCLALAGAEVIFHPTLGGAAIGDHDISLAAFRTRAVENFVYIVVAQRERGSMIISPQGKVLAEAPHPDSLAIADIDPWGGRAGGDAMNWQADMRARLFRERNPAAFAMLSDPQPPVLSKLPATISNEEAVQMFQKVLTVGAEQFEAADALMRAGNKQEAIVAFTCLCQEYRGSWIARRAAERLAQLQAP